MTRPRPNALPWLGLSMLLIALDQLTKWIVLRTIELHERITVIPGFFDWTLTFNPGAAFSFLSDAAGWQRWFFSALAVGISALLAYWLARTPRRDWRTALPFALVIGGALGNLVDRLVHGQVVDFVLVYWRSYYWPAFNLADSAIVVGAVLIVLFSLVPGKAAADAR
ncbi:signal peptidase II [Coralloluteibacterium stylophorae]|uniref:Lipoprotein signal peptidase n=2 Tax=Coralloluteibacterium stylophorae TaxID=1776034 RepID=A0AAP2CEJ2_9GAMM|nr:signal peptidase II [Coralloluteibacterium stylophorae]MBS7458900.1 signal peptidase II [Coralloluteibacterium stylophorae]